MTYNYTMRFHKDGRIFDHILWEIERVEQMVGHKPFMIVVNMKYWNEFWVYLNRPEDYKPPDQVFFLNGVRLVFKQPVI